MGRYRERDAQKKDDFSGLDEIDTEEDERIKHDGGLSFQGIEQALEKMRQNDEETSQELERPEKVLLDDEIDFDAIRRKANHMYFVNSQDHLDTPESKNLEIGVQADYEEMTEALMDYLQDDGVEALNQYVAGDLENDAHWANLVGLGVVEGEQELSNLGEYVSEQVFEYSD